MTNAAAHKTAHDIHTLIEALNAKAAKAAEAGCDIRAEHITLDRTWGDKCGIAISGNGDHSRAVKFAKAYFDKHIQPRRSYDAQYSWGEPATIGVLRSEANGGRLYVASNCRKEPEFTVTAIALVYWPCEG